MQRVDVYLYSDESDSGLDLWVVTGYNSRYHRSRDNRSRCRDK
jgi:hypothetical protein